ncbi:hypothetical protein Fot_04777 [Forsythia ovata]|uniref:Uncharacterized protein n=1 Tax=Forsythia ovata TaxID=205694 RepID=A0ABD1XDL1_9LAMI
MATASALEKRMSYENADSQNMSDPQTDPQIMDEAQSLPDHDEEVPRVMLAKSFHSLLFAMLRRGLQGLAETLSLRVLFANHEGKDLNSEIHIPWKAIKSEGLLFMSLIISKVGTEGACNLYIFLSDGAIIAQAC